MSNQQDNNKANYHYKTGYATGTFDPLHDGHIDYLNKASCFCDKLIVGVSTDEVVETYKHHKTMLPFDLRLRTIQNLKSVSLAIPQNDLNNKLEICKNLGVDVVFSSDEYLPSSYEENYVFTQKELDGIERWQRFSEELNSNGIDVIFLERNASMSSTSIKENYNSNQEDLEDSDSSNENQYIKHYNYEFNNPNIQEDAEVSQ